MNLNDRIQEAAKEKGVNQNQIAIHMKVSRTAVSGWWYGKNEDIQWKRLERLASFLGVTEKWLGSGIPPKYSIQVKQSALQQHYLSNVGIGSEMIGHVPLIEWAMAGDWNEAIEVFKLDNAKDWIPAYWAHGPKSYALRVEGDSMNSTNVGKHSYLSGDILIVDPEQIDGLTNGDKVIAVLLNDNLPTERRVLFKCVAFDGASQFLYSLNTNYKPIYSEFEIIGKVIGRLSE